VATPVAVTGGHPVADWAATVELKVLDDLFA
jgi:hypothetical protein